ncbi:PKD domain-containing protein [Conexibacter woesei]|uniref:PKD domain-containing protein n=1 Tax=Conexibacter woesei TaxID=191495 RepID=UPI000323A889|nr:PKD domain-containing protein [Conexibacter woesei]
MSAALLLPVPASAVVQGYAEPTYTKTSGNDAFWWRWTATTGGDANGNVNYTWYLCFRTYANGVLVEDSNGTSGPGTQNCTGSLRSGPSPSQADYAAMPFQTNTVLQDGTRYDMCASGFYLQPFIWKWDSTSACPWTIVDRNRPQLSVTVGGAAQYTRNPALPLRIDYADATSPPWAGAGGVASNWTCINRGAACSPSGAPNAACSTPADPASRTTFFSCTADVSAQLDGDWYVCAFAADGAVPDNPSGVNQFAQATSNNANLSGTTCGHIVLDRVAPSVTAAADATTVTVGQIVHFSATTSDASGVPGQVEWDFGDNTARGSGTSASHTYTQAGTYQAKASTADGAGNAGAGTVTITVQPAPGGGSGGPGTPPGAPTTPGTPRTPGAPTTPGTPSAPTNPAPGPGTVTQAPSPGAISEQSGGGGTQRTSVAGLSVTAPRRFKLTPSRRKLPLAFTVATPGAVDIALVRAGAVVARGGTSAHQAGTFGFSLKLPTRAKAGTYTLKIVFRPTGKTARTKTLRITVVRPKTKKKPAMARTAARLLQGVPLAR